MEERAALESSFQRGMDLNPLETIQVMSFFLKNFSSSLKIRAKNHLLCEDLHDPSLTQLDSIHPSCVPTGLGTHFILFV